jgi:hypothetical protein
MNTLLDWNQMPFGQGQSPRMVGCQEDIGIPWCICTECILSKGIHMFGPNVSHSTVKGGKQTQIDSRWALLNLHQKTSSFIVRGHSIVSGPLGGTKAGTRGLLTKSKENEPYLPPDGSPVGKIHDCAGYLQVYMFILIWWRPIESVPCSPFAAPNLSWCPILTSIENLLARCTLRICNVLLLNAKGSPGGIDRSLCAGG